VGVMEGHMSHTTWELWRDMCHTQLGNDGGTCVARTLGVVEGHISHTTWQ